MSELEKVTINKYEYNALEKIRGLAQDAHLMVMTADEDGCGRYILSGKTETFDELANDLSDEIYYELSPKSQLRYIKSLYNKVKPQYEEYD